MSQPTALLGSVGHLDFNSRRFPAVLAISARWLKARLLGPRGRLGKPAGRGPGEPQLAGKGAPRVFSGRRSPAVSGLSARWLKARLGRPRGRLGKPAGRGLRDLRPAGEGASRAFSGRRSPAASGSSARWLKARLVGLRGHGKLLSKGRGFDTLRLSAALVIEPLVFEPAGEHARLIDGVEHAPHDETSPKAPRNRGPPDPWQRRPCASRAP